MDRFDFFLACVFVVFGCFGSHTKSPCEPGNQVKVDELSYCVYHNVSAIEKVNFSCPEEHPHKATFETAIVCSQSSVGGNNELPKEVCQEVGPDCLKASSCQPGDESAECGSDRDANPPKQPDNPSDPADASVSSDAVIQEPDGSSTNGDVHLLLVLGLSGLEEDPPEYFRELKKGIADFVADPQTAGIQVALQVFRTGDLPGECEPDSYLTPLVDFGEASSQVDTFESILATLDPIAGDGAPTPALVGAHWLLKELKVQQPDTYPAVILISRDYDTLCSSEVDYIDTVIDAARNGVPTFGVEIAFMPGEPPTGFSNTYTLGTEVGTGFAWRVDPVPESIRADLASVLAEIRDLATGGLKPDPTVFDPPGAPEPGTSMPIDPCDVMIHDDNLPLGECLDSHFENSCNGQLSGELGECLTMVSGCIGDKAYVGVFVRECDGVSGFVWHSCGSSRGGGMFNPDPTSSGFSGAMGYLCECDPATGQALNAQIEINGEACSVQPYSD